MGLIKIKLILFLCYTFVNSIFYKSTNIVVIIGDDIGWNDFGFHGQNQIPTPNIDALAYHGVVLNRLYTCPSGTASLAALLTGKYPFRYGLNGDSIEPGEEKALPLKEKLLPKYLKGLGYKTHLVGRWNLGYARKLDTPTWKGFDSFFGFWNKFISYHDYTTVSPPTECSSSYGRGLQEDEDYISIHKDKPGFEYPWHTWKPPHYTKDPEEEYTHTTEHPTTEKYTMPPHWTKEKPTWHPPYSTEHTTVWKPYPTKYPTYTKKPPKYCHMHGFDLHDGLKPMWEKKGKYATHLFTDKACEIIENHNKKEPFFLMVSHLAGHCGANGTALEVPNIVKNDEEFFYIKDKKRRRYAGMVKEFDLSVGRILKALEQKGVLHNTVVVVLSDNGPQTVGAAPNKGSCWPLKGQKSTPYEGAVRASAVVYSPLLKLKGQINNNLMHITDLLPTFVSMAGGKITDLDHMDGVDQWKCIKEGIDSPRSELLINIDDKRHYGAIITHGGKYKLVNCSTDNDEDDDYYGESGRGILNPPYDILRVTKCDAYSAIKKMEFLGSFFSKEDKDDKKLLDMRSALDLFGKCNDLRRTLYGKKKHGMCLYDLYEDPCETTDISDYNLSLVETLKAKLDYFWHNLAPIKKYNISPQANPKWCHGTWYNWLDKEKYCEEPEKVKKN